MGITLRTLSEAPALAAVPAMDLARGSTIAKPQKAFAVAFAVLAAALAGCASGIGAGGRAEANGYAARVADNTFAGAQPISIDYRAAP